MFESLNQMSFGPVDEFDSILKTGTLEVWWFLGCQKSSSRAGVILELSIAQKNDWSVSLEWVSSYIPEN